MSQHTEKWVVRRRISGSRQRVHECRTEMEAIVTAQIWANRYGIRVDVIHLRWQYTTDKAKYCWQRLTAWQQEPDERGSLRQLGLWK